MNKKRGTEEPAEPLLEGLVLRSTGSWYDVRAGSEVIRATARGKFRLDDVGLTNPVAVGDHVTLRMEKDGTALITQVHERTNELSRRAAGRRVGQAHVIAANIDFAWIVQSLYVPRFNPGLIDRYLVTCEHSDIPAGIIINKIDLLEEEDREALMEYVDLYREIGYPVLLTSAITGESIDELHAHMTGKVNVFSGPSGVGKSALLNRVDPRLNLKTGEVSERTRKGKHTTTFATLFELSTGGYVVDTPGIREFGIVDLPPDQLSFYFVEFRPYIPECRFPSCTHDHEPDCAVMAAVEQGEISEIRYNSYLNILHSLQLGDKDVGR